MNRIGLTRIMAMLGIAIALTAFLPSENPLPPLTSGEVLLNPDDYKYYFVLNNQVRDIRDFSVVNEEMLTTSESFLFLSDDKQHLFTGNYKTHTYSRYSLAGKHQTSFQLTSGEAISPEWTHKVYVKNNDLWAVDLDWNTGTTSNDRQVTFLGAFNPNYGVSYAHWYKDKLIKVISQKCYIINTSNGDIRELVPNTNGYCMDNYSQFISPDGRYIYWNDRILDMETLDSQQSPYRGSAGFWKSNDEVLLGASNTNATIVDMKTATQKEVFNLNLFVMGSGVDNNRRNRFELSPWLSPSGKYFLFMESTVDHMRRTKPPVIWVGDTETSIRIATDLQIDRNPLVMDNTLKLRWTTDGTFIYGNQGDPLTQGTWFYDVHQQTKKKITPQVTTRIVVLEEAKKVLITANNHVFKMDLDGGNLEQLTTEPLGRWNQHLAGFLE